MSTTIAVRTHHVLLIIVAGVLAGPAVTRAVATPTWEVHTIAGGRSPDVWGTSYVWYSNDQVYLWHEGDPSPTVLADGYNPRISGDRVIWELRVDSADWEILQWHAGVITQLTDNTWDDRAPDAGGGSMVWLDQYDDHLILTAGPNQWTLPGGSHATVMNGIVVWNSEGEYGQEIHMWDQGTYRLLTHNQYDDTQPRTDGHSVVWSAYSGVGNTREIWRWRAGEGAHVLTMNQVDDVRPAVWGDAVVFSRNDGNDFELMLYYLGAEYQLTDNDYDDLEPEIQGNRVVWQASAPSGPWVHYAVLNGVTGGTPVGACCVAVECELLTEAECQQQGGAFQGAETLCHVDACGIGPAEGWSTYQHDAQRTGRASATVPDSPRRIWTQILGDSGTLTNTPTIGPDGSIYAASTSEDFVALKPDGSLRWKKWIFPRAPATVRADGNVLVPASSGLVRLNHVDGSELWGAPTKSDRGDVLPGALDADGNYYGGGTGGLFKRSADGTVLWSQEVDGDLYSHVALGTDGGVHASNGHSTFKLDPLSGLEVWSLSTGNESGGPAIGSTGTVYCTVDPNQLWARNPDGSEVWTHTFADTDFTIDVPFTGSPAIGADGTLYVPGHYSYPFRPAVVAVGADGMEKWMYVSTSESTRVPAPVIDGAGTVLFQDGARLVGLSPSDGSVLWHVESEICRSAPAIADDGTVYVVTMDGRLIVYGDGCPENVVQQTEYSYRVAARVGDVILGHNVNSLGGFDLQENGRVSFEAGVAAGGFAFVEQSDGAFEAIGPGMILGGQQLTEVRLPRIDANGNVYLPASTAESGPVVYVNGQVFVQTDPGGSGPVTLLSFASTEYLEHDDAGRLLVFGRRIGDSWPALLSIDTATHDVTPEIQQYEVIDGFRVESITPDGAHGLGDDGTVVAEVESTGQFAIVTQDSLIVRSGDMVGGHRIDRPREPRRDSAGGIHYRTGPIFQYLPSGEQRMIHALLDTIDGEPATTYLYLDGNRRGDIAYVAQLLAQRRGVFVNNKAVAIAEVTEIAGQRVSGIESAYPRWVSINEAGQVAFVVQFEDGTDALIVATPQLPLDANANGAVDLDDYALFSDCLTGPGMYVTPECAIFDVNGDCQVDLVDWGLFQEIFGGTDCNGNGSADILDVYLDRSEDCNANRIPDECDIASGESADLNTNGVPDECDPDCNGNGVPDGLDIAAGTSADCNANAVPDECDVTSGTSADCNANGIPDSCDIAAGTSTDCTGNQVPDTCEPDCDGNGVADSCDIHDGTESDCDGSGVPDSCEIAQGAVPDCNGNGIPDDCDADCDMNGVPDDCEPFVDCNANGVTDACDIANGTSFDWNRNGQPDECEPDCDGDTLPDDCELWWNDCNGNGVPDDCESAAAD